MFTKFHAAQLIAYHTICECILIEYFAVPNRKI